MFTFFQDVNFQGNLLIIVLIVFHNLDGHSFVVLLASSLEIVRLSLVSKQEEEKGERSKGRGGAGREERERRKREKKKKVKNSEGG